MHYDCNPLATPALKRGAPQAARTPPNVSRKEICLVATAPSSRAFEAAHYLIAAGAGVDLALDLRDASSGWVDE